MVERHSSGAERAAEAPSLKDLVSDGMRETRATILSLFRQNKTSIEIARTMNGELSGGVRTDEAVASLIRKLILREVPEEERRQHESDMRKLRAERDRDASNEGRDKAFRERGMKVWTAEEAEYFMTLLLDDAYERNEDKQTKKRKDRKRRKHLNHVALAQAMNDRFDTKEFTPEKTASRL